MNGRLTSATAESNTVLSKRAPADVLLAVLGRTRQCPDVFLHADLNDKNGLFSRNNDCFRGFIERRNGISLKMTLVKSSAAQRHTSEP